MEKAAIEITRLLVRYGPPPGATEDAEGNISADFSGALSIDYPADCVYPRAEDGGEDPFEGYVKELWAQLTAEGVGHMLVSAYGSLEIDAARQSCALQEMTLNEIDVELVPRDVKLLYGAVRYLETGGGFRDVFMDYRGDSPADRRGEEVIRDALENMSVAEASSALVDDLVGGPPRET